MTKKIMNQQEVTENFVKGIDNKQSPTGNLFSSNGVLTHYYTLEALRTNDNKYIIENSECWASGWARCPNFYKLEKENPDKIFISLPLTYIFENYLNYGDTYYELKDRIKIEEIIIKEDSEYYKNPRINYNWLSESMKACLIDLKLEEENKEKFCMLSYYSEIDYYFRISIDGQVIDRLFKDGEVISDKRYR